MGILNHIHTSTEPLIVPAIMPKVMTNSVFITDMVNSYQHRKVGTCNLPGAFLTTVNNKHVIMVLRGELCKLMVKVNPTLYQTYVLNDRKGIFVLYVELYKSMNGLMCLPLLFY